MTRSSNTKAVILTTILVATTRTICFCLSLSLSSYSSFHGSKVVDGICQNPIFSQQRHQQRPTSSSSSWLTMRKQKASDKRTRRMQRGNIEDDLAQTLIEQSFQVHTITSSPMDMSGGGGRGWSGQRRKRSILPVQQQQQKTGGRGRSRKRATLYNSLSSYHNKFLGFLTEEYKAEENEVLARIKASLDDPLSLEVAGHTTYDMYPERRGNLYSDEVYRLTKAKDASFVYNEIDDNGDEQRATTTDRNSSPAPEQQQRYLPPNHKFSNNDVILLTLQPRGSGDYYEALNLPTTGTAVSIEGRVISTGPTYIDVAIANGIFESAFGPAPNNYGPSGRGDPNLRLRADRFFSNIPYTRMVGALTQLTSVPDHRSSKDAATNNNFGQSSDGTISGGGEEQNSHPRNNIKMDDLFKEAIISTYSFTDPESVLFHDDSVCDIQRLNRMLSKPPMPSSTKLANEALRYIQQNPQGTFNPMNGPQLAAVGAALTRKLTLIQGPPGTGKTTTASAIGFGFTHQCRLLSPNSKVLACAFSNVGADNLAEGFLKLGLKVVRVGKPSAVSEHLWDITVEAAIDKDPDAQKALNTAAKATALLADFKRKSKKDKKSSIVSERMVQDAATAAVKQSIRASNVAATKAFRNADIIVSTSTGAADPRLISACGLGFDIEDFAAENGVADTSPKKKLGFVGTKKNGGEAMDRVDAPDGLPPLSLPFVIVDEACQSVEPATLIPLTASNSCRALVLLGDPCQLPATVKSSADSPLGISLMERLSATLPAPMINMKNDNTALDSSHIESLPIKQARSLMRYRAKDQQERHVTYRKQFAGSLLLGIQYRMHPSIAAFSSAMFYDGLLGTPTELEARRPIPTFLHRLMPCGNPRLGVRLINVGGRCNESRGERNTFVRPPSQDDVFNGQESTTFTNEAEAVRVVSLIKDILRWDNNEDDPSPPKTIGVITPYAGQVQLIKSLVSSDPEIVSQARSRGVSVEVKSVDGYQGRERDVVIFSAVRSNRRGNVGFLKDWRRLNVALTRARSALLVVGDSDTLFEGDRHWASFVKYCHGARCVIDDSGSPNECDSL